MDCWNLFRKISPPPPPQLSPRRRSSFKPVKQLCAAFIKAFTGVGSENIQLRKASATDGTDDIDETNATDLEGSFINVYRPETLQQLCKLTKFSKKELQIMYRGFKEGCTSGLLTLEEFKDIYARFFPQGDSSHYATFIFNTFDADGNGQISFDEFVLGLSVISRGSEDEKLRWVFNLYDLDRDGYLSRHDIETVLTSIYDMMGTHTNPPVEENTIRQHADDIFGRMDVNCDGLITFREFLNSCKKDAEIIESLHLFDTVLSTGSHPSRSHLAKFSC